MTIKVVIASGHVLIADSLQALLESQPDIRVVGKAANGHDAIRRIRRLQPDIAILWIGLPGLNGIDAAAKLRKMSLPTKVVLVSKGLPSEYAQRALQAGAKGYLPAEASGAELIEAVRAVARGKRYLSRKVTTTIVQDYIRMGVAASPLDLLSAREREVLQLIAEGQSSAHIGSILSLSAKTVDTYRSRLRQKLSLHSVADLVKFAIRHGITTAE
jgi:DNA-binding NarL/FixJ family response regulator